MNLYLDKKPPYFVNRKHVEIVQHISLIRQSG